MDLCNNQAVDVIEVISMFTPHTYLQCMDLKFQLEGCICKKFGFVEKWKTVENREGKLK